FDSVKRLTGKQCPQCTQMFQATTKLKLHVAAVHMRLKLFQCRLCKKKLAYSWAAKAHCSSNVEDQSAGKDEPSAKQQTSETVLGTRDDFGIPKELAASLTSEEKSRFHSVKELTSTQCTWCYKMFPGLSRLKLHVAVVHLKLKLYHCPTCKK